MPQSPLPSPACGLLVRRDNHEVPITGQNGPTGETRWIFTGANGHYLVGTFDGTQFTPESGPRTGDYGGNFYAVSMGTCAC